MISDSKVGEILSSIHEGRILLVPQEMAGTTTTSLINAYIFHLAISVGRCFLSFIVFFPCFFSNMLGHTFSCDAKQKVVDVKGWVSFKSLLITYHTSLIT